MRKRAYSAGVVKFAFWFKECKDAANDLRTVMTSAALLKKPVKIIQ